MVKKDKRILGTPYGHVPEGKSPKKKYKSIWSNAKAEQSEVTNEPNNSSPEQTS